ncbi:MAG: hypothetical protein AB7I04_21190 [Pseudomonadales bacterium]
MRQLSPYPRTFYCLLGIVFNLLLAASASAAERRDVQGVTDQQISQLERVMQEIDQKILGTIGRQGQLAEEMTTELQKLAAVNDPRIRARAVGDYQARYRKSYADALTKSGVVLPDVARQLGSIFPEYDFKATSGLFVIGRHRLATGSAPVESPVPVAETHDILPLELEVEQERHCGGLGDGSVSGNGYFFRAYSAGALAGGCLNRGTARAVVSVPRPRQSARLDLRADLYVDGLAVGVGGTAVVTAKARYHINCGSIVRLLEAEVLVLAPILWVGTAEEALRDQSVSIGIPDGAISCSLLQPVEALVVAVAGLSFGSATVTNISASLTVER